MFRLNVQCTRLKVRLFSSGFPLILLLKEANHAGVRVRCLVLLLLLFIIIIFWKGRQTVPGAHSLLEILRHQQGNLTLQIKEAISIKEFSPTLNRRSEDLGTGFLP